MHIGIVGALGLVGKELIALLEKGEFKSSFSPITLKGYGSKSRPAREGFCFLDSDYPVYTLEELYKDLSSLDLLFIATPNAVSKKIVAEAKAQKARCLIIDGSSAFRMEKKVPLIIPEINLSSLSLTPEKGMLIASPNCVATLMLLALSPLHQAFGLKRVISSSYQAASGGGKALLETLIDDTKAFMEKGALSKGSKAFNTYLHESELLENGYVSEEVKVIEEVRKILDLPDLPISLRAIRIPSLRSHGISLNLEFEKKPDLEKAKAALEDMPGITYLSDSKKSATAQRAAHQKEVLCSGMRIDASCPYALELWVVGDQLLKGSALNMMQIAKSLVQKNSLLAHSL